MCKVIVSFLLLGFVWGGIVPLVRAQDAPLPAISLQLMQNAPGGKGMDISVRLLSPSNGHVEMREYPIAHTTNMGRFCPVTWSPDRTLLTFEHYPPEGVNAPSMLCCLDTARGVVRELGPTAGLFAPLYAWLPGSHDLVMLSPGATNTLDIVRVTADTPTQRTVLASLSELSAPWAFALAPTGSAFAVLPTFPEQDGGAMASLPTVEAVWIADIDGKHLQRYALPASMRPPPMPYWSDDGNYLLITTAEGPRLWQASTRAMTTPAITGTVLGWLPKSTELIIAEQNLLEVLDVKTGAQTLLATFPAVAKIVRVAASPSGETLACYFGTGIDFLTLVQRRQPSKILTLLNPLHAKRDARDLIGLAPDGGSNYAIAWSPDGQWLAATYKSAQQPMLTLFTAQGERTATLPNVGAYWWTPDSRRLILQRPNALLLSSLDGEQTVPLLTLTAQMRINEVGMGNFPPRNK